MMPQLLIDRPAGKLFWLTPTIGATALVAAALLVPQEPTIARGALLIIAAVGPYLAAIDWREHRLPDLLVLPAALGVVVVLVIAALWEQEWARLGVAALCALGTAGFFFALFMFRPDEMGFGDVKISFALGMMLGWQGLYPVLAGVILGLLIAFAAGLVQMALRRAQLKTLISMGQYLLLGSYLIGLMAY